MKPLKKALSIFLALAILLPALPAALRAKGVQVYEIACGSEVTVNVETRGEIVYYRFVPDETAVYRFYSDTYQDVEAALYDADMNRLQSNDDDGVSLNFRIDAELTANETCYFAALFHDSGEVGSFTARLVKLPADSSFSAKAKDGRTAFRAAPGDDVTLEVEATAAAGGPVRYRWYAANHPEESVMLPETGPVLTVENVTETSYYYCLAEDAFGSYGAVIFTVYCFADVPIVPGAETAVTVDTDGQKIYFSFTPDETATYRFYSQTSYDVEAALYTADMTCVKVDDDGGTGLNFMIDAALSAGETYYYAAYIRNGYTGSFSVKLLRLPENCSLTLKAKDNKTTFRVASGGNVTLQAEASSAVSEEIRYAWYASNFGDESALLPETGPALTVENVTGQCWYFCRAEDEFGSYGEVCFTLYCFTALPIVLNAETTVTVAASNETVYYEFTPAETAVYRFYSQTDEDVEGELFDADMNSLLLDDDGGTDVNFLLEPKLTAGETYYFGARYHSGGRTGSFPVFLVLQQENGFSAERITDELTFAHVGDTPTLAVRASCTEGDVHYRWRDTAAYIYIDGAEESIYQLPEFTKGAKYECVVRDDRGNSTGIPFEIVNLDAVTYEWREDHSVCTAKYADVSPALVEIVSPTIEVVPAVGSTPGKVIYTAAFQNPRFFTQTAEVELEPAAPSGECGDGVLWVLEENEDSYWADPDGNPVENPGGTETEDVRWEARYTLVIKGVGVMDDYRYPDGEDPVGCPPPWADYRNGISRVDVESGVSRIGENAFRWSANLRTVTLREGLRSIGAFAFESCVSGRDDGSGWYAESGLAGVTLPATVTYIGRFAFGNNGFLNTVNFSGSLETVCLAGDEEFADRTGAERVREVFGNTPWFESWFSENYMQGTCGDGLTWTLTENEDSFWMYDETGDPVTDPADAGVNGTHYERRLTLKISGEGAMEDYNYGESEGAIKRQPWEASRWEISRVEVGEGVTRVGSSALRWSNNLRTVTLPAGLVSIGAWAFESCRSGEGDETEWHPTDGLARITIPDSVTYIGRQAFANNDYLETVNFGGDLEAVCLAGDEDFADRTGAERVREAFGNTAWFENWFNENYMQGTCGDGLTWTLTENEDGFWAYDETNDPVTDPADEGKNGTHYERRLTLAISGEGAMDDYNYEKWYGDTVRQPWEASRGEISRVQVGDGVTRIGDSAFRWTNNLRTVTLPDGLESIGAWAFENCMTGEGNENEWHPTDGLARITLPGTVTLIGRQAFAHNEYLDTVNFVGDLEAVCLAGDEEFADRTGAERVREAFEGTPWFENWFSENYMQGICGTGVTWRLEENADGFWAYDGTDEPVTDPADEGRNGTHYERRLTLYIEGEGAMEDYNYGEYEGDEKRQPWEASRWEISRVQVSAGVTHVGGSALRWCDHLRTVSLPDGLESIGGWAFERCVAGWGDENGWYAESGLAAVTVPSTVTYIGQQAFAHNDFLETVTFGGDLEAVCLAGDDWAQDWHPAQRVRDVFEGTVWFENWFNENYMQGDCGAGLTWTLTENEDGFWMYDESRERVTDPADEGKEGTHFERRLTLTVTGAGAMDDYGYDEAADVDVRPPWDASRWEISRVQIGAGVTHIGASAFCGSDNLRVVSLPDGLESIGEWAFERCVAGEGDENEWHPTGGLTQITIPDSVTYIGRMAFAHNDYLETVNFGGDLPSVCLAGEDWAEDWHPADRVREVFEGTAWNDNWFFENYMQGECGDNVRWTLEKTGDGIHVDWRTGEPVFDEALFDSEFVFYAEYYRLTLTGTGEIRDYTGEERPVWTVVGINITELVIGEGVTAIGEAAFADLDNLRTVSLPASLLTVKADNFKNCGMLGDLYYGSCDESAYRAIAVSAGNERLADAGLHLAAHDFTAERAEDRYLKSAGECTGAAVYYKSCTRCGAASDTETFTTAGYAEHDLVNHPAKAPTCTEPGWEAYQTCTRCSYTTFIEIPALGHDLTAYEGKAATCTEKGWNAYNACSRCTYSTYTEIPALGHDYGEWRVAKAPTCTVSGTRIRSCSRCTAVENGPIAPTGHSYGDWTSLDENEHARICANDSTHLYKEKHTWNAGSVTKPATMFEPGEKTYVCTVCGAKRTEELGRLPDTATADDPATGVTLTYGGDAYPRAVTLRVAAADVPEGALPADYGKTYALDISTYVGTEEAGPNAPVTVSFPVPEGFNADTLGVYVIKSDGTVEEPAFTVENGRIVITAGALGTFAAVDTSTEKGSGAVLGDVDGDGKFSAADARLALRASVKLESFWNKPDDVKFIASDVDKDGKISASDARMILRASVKLEDPAKW